MIRFFEYKNSDTFNPGPGTCVDNVIVQKDGPRLFEFVMVSNNNPTSATALPVVYNVVHNTSNLSKQEIEEFTHHQCFGYFGFSGPIKTPAAVKYAEKLAQCMTENEM
eukprot:CAMPEP_0170485494 /NCGR_PEP_ID=MMETSP0208-20121228/4760_1 /TAXON_ID=197538 /ORGANISM="Strombidium inclinatum, Strain S3" /LENGTH=107 /DNA_ID=CAMNT_0010759177 /DNA_START=1208 /DNA_END=1528 /DNA_ORIENTATION=-